MRFPKLMVLILVYVLQYLIIPVVLVSNVRFAIKPLIAVLRPPDDVKKCRIIKWIMHFTCLCVI